MEHLISYKKILTLSFPLIIAQSVVLLSGIIDLAFVGPLGTDAIAAVSIANAVCATIFNFLEGFRLGTTVLVSRYSAAGSSKNTSAILNTALFLAAIIGGIILLSSSYISQAVYGSVGNQHIKDLGLDYLKIWLWTVPVILLSHVLTGLFRGLRDTATPLYNTILVCVCNAVFSYFLVYGGWGMAGLGVTGAALGTFCANWAGLLFIAFLVWHKRLTAAHVNFKAPFLSHIKEYLALASDIGMNTGFTLLALLAFVFILKQLGPSAMAVHQITLQIFNFAYLPAMGFLITASILVPPLLENQQGHLLLPTVKRISQMSLTVILLTSGLICLFAPCIGRFFSPADAAVAEKATETLRLCCIGQLFCSVYMVLRGTLTACKDTRFIVYEGLFSGYFVFLPLAYLLAIQLGFGVYGGYVAFVIWCITDCAALTTRFFLKKVRKAAYHTA